MNLLNVSFLECWKIINWNKKWAVVKTRIQVSEKQDIQQFSPDIFSFLIKFSMLIIAKHFL